MRSFLIRDIRSGVLVSFAEHVPSPAQSFPPPGHAREGGNPEGRLQRESTSQAMQKAPPRDWIPAFAGMTADLKEIRFQMTPPHSSSHVGPLNNHPDPIREIRKIMNRPYTVDPDNCG